MAARMEHHLRDEDVSQWLLVIRGRPLTTEALLLAAGRTMSEFTWRGAPVAAISAEVTGADRTTDDVLAGPRRRTRRTYASAPISELLEGGFQVLPTFVVTHVSVCPPGVR